MPNFKVVEKEDVVNKSSISWEDIEQNFIVTEKAVRIEGPDGKCYCCGRNVGENHSLHCCTIQEIIRIPISGTIVVPVPAHYTPMERAIFANDLYSDAIDVLINEFWIEGEVDDFQDYNDWSSYLTDSVRYLDEESDCSLLKLASHVSEASNVSDFCSFT